MTHPCCIQPELSRVWLPAVARSSIRTRQHHSVTIRVAQPAFPVVGAAVSFWWIAVGGQEYVCLQFLSPGDGIVKVVHFKPEQHPVAIRFG